MVDGSKVHKKLGGRYQADYKCICEGEHSPEDISRSLIKKLVKDAKDCGPIPVELLRKVSDMLEPAADQPLFMTRNDWVVVQQWIEQATRAAQFRYAQDTTKKSRVGIEAARLACEQQVIDIRRGVKTPEGGVLQGLVEKYLSNIHDMNFAGKVPLNPKHYLGVDHETINARLAAVELCVHRDVPALARQLLDEHRDINTVRAPNRTQPKPGVDIDSVVA